MTEREKIINIVEQNKYCDVNTAASCRECKYGKELENYKDMGCSSLKTADALIEAGIGDVTEWKERLKKLKKTQGDLTVEEEINILESLVEEAKHRSFVFEKELVKYKIAFDKAIKLAYKLRTDLDVLSCSSCEFGYALDTCKKIGLYDDCENRWKEELLQQVESEIEEEDKR